MAGFSELSDTVRRLEGAVKALEGQIAELKARPLAKTALPEPKSSGMPANPNWCFTPLNMGPVDDKGGSDAGIGIPIPVGTADRQMLIWLSEAWTLLAAPTVARTYISWDGTDVKWDYMRCNSAAP